MSKFNSDVEFITAICAQPEADEHRREYAAWLRSYDAARARFIELQLDRAQRRRTRRELADPTPEESDLLRTHEREWSHTIAKYAARVTFDRGFITSISIEPYVFLEYGAWFLKNAPIRHVSFRTPEDGEFPLDELVASPVLGELDAISLVDLHLDDAAVEKFANGPHLKRCVWLDLSYNALGLPAFRALAASPTTRRFLFVGRRQGAQRAAERYWPGETSQPTDKEDRWGAPIWEWRPPSPEGKALEREFGYLPWLHHENFCQEFDARWYVDHCVLPVKPAGSSVG